MILTFPAGTGRWLLRLLGLSLVLSLLSACSGYVREQATAPADWDQRHRQQAAITDWRLSARMAVQTADNGGSLDVFWTQTGESFLIRLVAPLGQGAMQLRGNGDHVEARLADGSTVSGAPEDLLEQGFGVRVPVDALGYWLRGIAAAADYSRASWNAQGDLYRLSQHGWRVEMRDYREVAGRRLPTRFYLESAASADTNLRFIVRDWKL